MKRILAMLAVGLLLSSGSALAQKGQPQALHLLARLNNGTRKTEKSA